MNGASTQAREATFTLQPNEVQIGQPLTATAIVIHDSSDGLVADVKAPFLHGEDWVLLSGPERSVDRLPEGGARTTLTWEYMALEPGEHAVTDWTVDLIRGGSVELPSSTLTVQGELTALDEAPRDLAPELPAPPAQASGGLLPLLILLMLLAVVAFWWRSKKRDEPEDSTASTGLRERLQNATWEESEGKEQLFAWHRDLRLLADLQLGQDRRSWTDAEWIQAGPEGTGIAAADWPKWTDLLTGLETHKFAERLPSRLTGEGLALGVRELVSQRPATIDSAIGGAA